MFTLKHEDPQQVEESGVPNLFGAETESNAILTVICQNRALQVLTCFQLVWGIAWWRFSLAIDDNT